MPADGDLQDLVIRTYPYPIAVPYRACTEQESPTAQFGCLLDTFESLVHYLATVAVSAYFRSGAPDLDCNRRLLDHFLKENWTTGDLWGLLRDTVQRAGDCGGLLPYPELPPYLFDAKGEQTPSLKVLASFVTLRNRAWGHNTGRDDDFFAKILPEHQPRLEQELAAVAWVARWKLVRPLVIDESGKVTKADVLMGDRRLRGQPFDLTLDAGDSPWQGGDVRAEKTLLLTSPQGGRYLPLFPLSLFQLQNRSQGMFFLQRTQWQKSADRRQLRKACYVAYESGLGQHEESPGETAVRALEERIRELEAKLRAAGVAPAPRTAPAPAEPAVAEADPDHELPEVRHEQAAHLRTFAGREELLKRVSEWVARSPQGGYLLLKGPPGQGKSALAAELARRLQAERGCLLHMVKSHRNPRKFLPALLTQAARLAKTTFGADAYGGDVDDLRNTLLRALEAVRRTAGRAVLVLDALDELELSGERLDFLPPALPEGARVVLTARPHTPLLEALRARVRDLEEWEVPPLSEADLRPVLERRLGPEALKVLDEQVDWSALFRRLQGNPLFLQRALDRIVKAASAAPAGAAALDVGRLPANLETLFRDIYDEIAERDGTRSRREEGRQKGRLLQFLCLAREPLDVDQLAELMAAAGMPLFVEDCRDRLLELSQYLLDAGGGRFQPWHQGLVDFVRAEVLGATGVRQVEELVCAWLRRPADRLGRYGLRHRAQHLHAAGRADELFELMTDLPFLEARVEAGLVYELPPDFYDAAGLLPAKDPRRPTLWLLAEALRTDIHFIARHPTALFQCLWNRCWWYDCAAAEPHYDPPPGGWPPEGAPWRRSGPRLSALMEAWRKAKEQASPGFRWLRTLRPRSVPLGGAQRTVFHGHEEQVRGATYSPDGRRVVSAADDGTVRVWETVSSRELHCLRGHQGKVYAVAFSPDGRRVVSAGEDRTLRVWDPDGYEVACLRGHRGPVFSVAFSPDGRRVTSASRDKTVRVWDLARGEQLACLGRSDDNPQSPLGHNATASCAAFSADGGRIVSCGWDRTMRVWDAAGGQQLMCLTKHSQRVNSVAISPDGRRLVSGACDGDILLWGAEGGDLLGRTSLGSDWPAAVTFSPDGAYVVSGSHRGKLQVWDGHTLAELTSRTGHDGVINFVSFSRDGRRLLSGGWDRTVRAWNVLGGAETGRLRGDDLSVLSLVFSHDGRLLAGGDFKGEVHLWDTATGLEVARWVGHTNGVRALAFGPDDRRLVSGSRDSTVRVWEVAAGREVACFIGHEATIRAVAFAPDGRRLLSGSRDRTARLWDAETGAELLRLAGHEQIVQAVAFDPDGRRLATGEVGTGTVRVWDAADGRELACLCDELRAVDRIAFAPDGRRLAARGFAGVARVWDLADGRCVRLDRGPGEAAARPQAWLCLPEWHVIGRGPEMAFLRPGGSEEVGWFPARLARLIADASGRVCAGMSANRLWLFCREGEEW
jgi:WD40 repeat protein